MKKILAEMEKYMSDKQLLCKDCGNTFVFTEREQEFYKEKQFQNEPQRCPACRAAKKQQIRTGRGSFNNAPREMFDVTCTSCGKETQVPFQPTGDKPIFCRECYQDRRR
jgi:CxxC-x17-CxxC domain-containing protein